MSRQRFFVVAGEFLFLFVIKAGKAGELGNGIPHGLRDVVVEMGKAGPAVLGQRQHGIADAAVYFVDKTSFGQVRDNLFAIKIRYPFVIGGTNGQSNSSLMGISILSRTNKTNSLLLILSS